MVFPFPELSWQWPMGLTQNLLFAGKYSLKRSYWKTHLHIDIGNGVRRETQSIGQREVSLPTPTQEQSCGLVPLGSGGIWGSQSPKQTDLPVSGIFYLSLVSRHGTGVLWEWRGNAFIHFDYILHLLKVPRVHQWLFRISLKLPLAKIELVLIY